MSFLSFRLRARTATLIAAIVVVAASSASSAAADPQRDVYPGKSWAYIDDLRAAGWSRSALDDVRAHLAKTKTTGFIAIAGGRVLLEYGDVKSPLIVASMRKSVLSILYGRHVANGTIRLDATLAELGIDDHGKLTTAERQATVRDLLSARSGVYHPAQIQGDDFRFAPPRGSQPHGSYFLYNNWDFNALGTIFEMRTGRDIYDEFDAQLARPLRMQDFDRAAQRKGGDPRRSIHPAYHFRLSTRDLARIGYLMLRNGKWEDRQLIPADWVKESTRVVTHLGDMNPASHRKGPWGYGYLWWVWDGPKATGAYRNAYTAHGQAGQHLSILPQADLVVAHVTRQTEDARVTHAEFRQILDELVRARCGLFSC